MHVNYIWCTLMSTIESIMLIILLGGKVYTLGYIGLRHWRNMCHQINAKRIAMEAAVKEKLIKIEYNEKEKLSKKIEKITKLPHTSS